MASNQRLSYMINHVFLPPKLPQEDDSSPIHDVALIEELKIALSLFKDHLASEEQWIWLASEKMLDNMLELRDAEGAANPERLQSSLAAMDTGDFLVLHVRGQNAGLIIRKLPKEVVFEMFELSPKNEAVIGTKGRLVRCFPGPAIAIGHDKLADVYFREALTQLLVQLDINTPDEAWPVVSKAGTQTIEIRDTVSPKFITEMLTGFLRGVGHSCDVNRIYKRTREDVLWNSTLQPWRRSPLWLLLRVALQTGLPGENLGYQHYKSFTIFFSAHLLKVALDTGCPSELLFVMAAKISRRVLKVETTHKPSWLVYARRIVEAAHEELKNRWHAVERGQSGLGLQKKLLSLSFAADTILSMNNLGPYLTGLSKRTTANLGSTQFDPGCRPRLPPNEPNLPQAAHFQGSAGHSTRLALMDLESWVEANLDQWLQRNYELSTSSARLAELIQDYVLIASSNYANHPEEISLMLLTTMRLWVALDTCATFHYPILNKYQPGFPQFLFNPLLLPTRRQMERLDEIERYVQTRTSGAIYNSALMFQTSNREDSFAVQYFQKSLHHRELRWAIEDSAENERSRKLKELREKQDKFRSLMQDYNSQVHEETKTWDNYRGRYNVNHSGSCQKCWLKRQADGLEITVHEWPLPYIDLEAKSAVFELDVPVPIGKWRDITYMLLVDLFAPQHPRNSSSNPSLYALQGFSGLKSYFKNPVGRIQHVSAAKPFTVSHYKTQKIPQATESNICVNNGLHYSMYDSRSSQWTSALLDRCDICKPCTFQLPPGLFRELQYALDGTTHTSNEVISRQANCPAGLGFHEFYAFSTLRSGHRLQWRNIARELRCRSLDLSHEETYLLLVQAAWQVACPGSTFNREAHVDLTEEEFGFSMVTAAQDSLSTVEGNWQGAVAVRILTILVARVLSLSPYQTVHDSCYTFLRRARNIALEWARDMIGLRQEERDEAALKVLNLRTLEVALTCCGTFEIDQIHHHRLLNSNEDISVITECSTMIHDLTTDKLSHHLGLLLRRHERRQQQVECRVRDLIVQDQAGLDVTIRQVWSGFRSGGPWLSLAAPNERWLVTKTADNEDCSSMTVHYNVLDGSLLVNGSPLTRLPRAYELHQTYRRILSEKVLDVVPSTMKGMIFQTRNMVCGQEIHFRMDGSELIICTRNNEQTCELIPLHSMKDDFPETLVQDFVHWLDVDTKKIEWRPLQNLWVSSNENWLMQIDGNEGPVLCRGSKRMIDIRSRTARTISQILSPLDSAINIHARLDYATGAVEVYLPRFKLDFLIRKGESSLESKQFRGMVVDEQQTFGAFTGLVHKLVLCEASGPSRCVLIPYGSASFRPENHHFRISIDTSAHIQVKHYSYQIDNRLGRLVDDGSLQSRLYRLYLHAVTSHCLKDQLTGHTGTEEALNGLAGAASFSFVQLGDVELELLNQLAQLAPRRVFYPNNLQVMQQVTWKPLSSLSQHCGFYDHVTSIIHHARTLQACQETPQILDISNPHGEANLRQRASLRESSFQVSGFGAESFTTRYDTVYKARDKNLDNIREIRVYRTARLVAEWPQNLSICRDILSEIESWRSPIRGPETEEELLLGFDLKWLDKSAQFFPRFWCPLQTRLSMSDLPRDKYKIMVLLTTLAYSPHVKEEVVHTLLAFATVPRLRALTLPSFEEYQLSDGYTPVRDKVIRSTRGHIKQFPDCPERNLPKQVGETYEAADIRRCGLWQSNSDRQLKLFAQFLTDQGPTPSLQTPYSPDYSTYISIQGAMESVRPLFQSWHRNNRFQLYFRQAQAILNTLPADSRHLESYVVPTLMDEYIPKRTLVNFFDLIKNHAPCLSASRHSIFHWEGVQNTNLEVDPIKLRALLRKLEAKSNSGHSRKYIKDLTDSFEALSNSNPVPLSDSDKLVNRLEQHLNQARRCVRNTYQLICDQLQAGPHDFSLQAQMLPRLSPTSLLAGLASNSVETLSHEWKSCLVEYGISITTLQRAERLLASARNEQELLAELRNPGHLDWDPLLFPDWLLLEIENDILIRQEQVQIAKEMISPRSGSNSLVQLNMGLGKSSVIAPIVSAVLANKKQLVRVIVLKPLAMQMFQLLAKRLGGMLNRRILYMPISRSLALSIHQARQIRQMYEECKSTGSILLLQPEHILSFELMGPEKLYSGDLVLGNDMIDTQNWLYANSRDILDESDEILSVRFELVYTIGTQRAIEFGPERWTIIQRVLSIVSRVAPQVLQEFPQGLEIITTAGFPRIRILHRLAGDELLCRVAQHLCDNGLPGVPVWSLPRSALFSYITDSQPDVSDLHSLQEFAIGSELMKSGLLLLRGLFACGVLNFAFERKRWRVNYGLHPSRKPSTMLAVPYHAKDSPAARAEFSHPDTTILLTCLSYYYGGLSHEQIGKCFEVLLKTDHAQEIYELWVKDAPKLSPEFRHLTGINLSNAGQCSRDVFPPLRFSRGIIDFYTSSIVFPSQMMEFPHKLSSSGWDIAREKSHPITGFSGTNDSRYILPLSIDQYDMPEHLSTNAAVLDCLLGPENSCADHDINYLTAEILLNLALNLIPPVQVILDVGAQVLELRNEELARRWLSLAPESKAQAVVFFDEQDELCVLSRDETKEPLQVSPFAKQMDQCLVYLDESHTRGTDLKLPFHYRALVTLGPNLPKDRLVQACMRMRKLGKGQSVVFCCPAEVRQKILECSGKNRGPIEVSDVLEWCISNTCASTKRSIPLWATQGIRHQNRRAAYLGPSGAGVTREVVESILEPEAQSLDQRYEYRGIDHEDQITRLSTAQSRESRATQLCEIRAKCQQFEILSFNAATLEEEQERELSPENEREVQVELPPAVPPHQHGVHSDVRLLITNGTLVKTSVAFQPAFDILLKTTASKHYDSDAWPKDLLVTTDFAKTVMAPNGQFLDFFLRPVHWIVTCETGNTTEAVVLSPYEAQELLPQIRQHKRVTLHVYYPRVSSSMGTTEDLRYCAIPPVPTTWSTLPVGPLLNLFAGQLYIRTYDEYVSLCEFLGICSRRPGNGVKASGDGFINPSTRANSDSVALKQCRFTKSPVAFVRMIMALRRKGQGISASHMGKMLNGELLGSDQF